MTPLLWHPARANPLDYVGDRRLVDRNGNAVEISKAMAGDFTVYIHAPGKYPVLTGGNIPTCAYLNQNFEDALKSLFAPNSVSIEER